MRDYIKTIVLTLLVLSLTFLIGYKRCPPKPVIDPNDPARVAQVAPAAKAPNLEKAAATPGSSSAPGPSSALSEESVSTARRSPDSVRPTPGSAEATPRPLPLLARSRLPRIVVPATNPTPVPMASNNRDSWETRNRDWPDRVSESGNRGGKDSRNKFRSEFRPGYRRSRDQALSNDETIKQYDQALAFNPAQPEILVKKAQALNRRGLDRLRFASNSVGYTSVAGDSPQAKDDFEEARALSAKALELIKAKPVPSDPKERSDYEATKLAALNTRAVTIRLLADNFDRTESNRARTAYQEYLAAETDSSKKLSARRELAAMLLKAAEFEAAKKEYEEILAQKPNDADALRNMSQTLYELAELKKVQGDEVGSAADRQEAGKYLRQSIEVNKLESGSEFQMNLKVMEKRSELKTIPNKSQNQPAKAKRGGTGRRP